MAAGSDPNPNPTVTLTLTLIAQLSMSEKQQWRAAYCAVRALKLGLQLATLTPLVARGYTLLFHVASSFAPLAQLGAEVLPRQGAADG